MSAVVMVYARVTPGSNEAFEEAFRQVSRAVRGTDGHLTDRLVRDAEDPTRYVLVGEWQSVEKFRAWEDAPIHRQVTSAMRPYWSGAVERIIYEVAVPAQAGTVVR